MTGDVRDPAPPGDGGAGGGRAEVDTSAPFKSVREAVDRFGGSATWSSHLIKRMFAPPKGTDESTNLKEQTAQLEKELSIKEKETLDVLKELASAKKFIADLKLKIQSEEAATFSICEEMSQAEATIAVPEERQSGNAEALVTETEERHSGNAEAHVTETEERRSENAEGHVTVPEEMRSEIAQVPIAEPKGRQTDNVETHVSVPEGRQIENSGTDVDMVGKDEHQQNVPGCSVLKDLEQAKANLNKTTSDLAAIRASVNSLRNEIAKEKVLVERCREKVRSSTTQISSLEDELDQAKKQLHTLRDLHTRRDDPSDIFMEIKKMTSELEQLRDAAKASKSEAIMLAAEIEQMKASIGTAEVRCLAAKKIEEAARAAEALALAEIKILLSNEASSEDLQGTDGVSLSVEEYSDLAAKALEADETLRTKVEAAMAQVDEANQSESDSLRKLEEAKLQVDECKQALQEALTRADAAKREKIAVEEALRRCKSAGGHKRRSLHEPLKFKNAAHRCKDSHNMDIIDVSKGSLKPTLSIGQILSMKLTGPDGYDKSVSDDTSETCNVSLGQILNRRRAVVYSSDTTTHKKLSGKRKKFAFTGLSVFLAKQAKSKKKRGSHQN